MPIWKAIVKLNENQDQNQVIEENRRRIITKATAVFIERCDDQILKKWPPMCEALLDEALTRARGSGPAGDSVAEFLERGRDRRPSPFYWPSESR